MEEKEINFSMKKKWFIVTVILLGFLIPSYCLFAKFYRKKCMQYKPLGLSIRGSYFEPVNITSFFHDIPCVEVEIDGKLTVAKVDLGLDGAVVLPKKFLNELEEKTFLRTTSFYGIRGKKYFSDLYEIPKIKIGKMAFFYPRAEEINSEFEEDATVVKDKKEFIEDGLGRIGWRLFRSVNLLLDCVHSQIVFCDSLNTLKERGYPVEDFIEVPMLLNRNIIEFEAMTEAGPLRCMLDTGSTLNLVNKGIQKESDEAVFDPKNYHEMPFFKIGGKNFGPMPFHQIETSFGINTVIGMEFLYSKLIFIDFQNSKIYFH